MPPLPLITNGPDPVKVACGACKFPALSKNEVLTELILRSNKSAVGDAGVLTANGTLPMAPEVSVRTGLVPISDPIKADTAEVPFPKRSWLAPNVVAPVPPPPTPRVPKDIAVEPPPPDNIGWPKVPAPVGRLKL